VLATKLNFKMHDGPGGSGLSRKAIMEQIDASLTRLGTDYVDLYQIPRFDPETPIEETMNALHDVIKAGKGRYLGQCRVLVASGGLRVSRGSHKKHSHASNSAHEYQCTTAWLNSSGLSSKLPDLSPASILTG
jgi:aryl-alcohol dehydrogenase-like predicted oxidoreductase